MRWFSPKAEVGLCGHATLASAHVLWKRNYSQECGNFVFHQGGLLTAQYKEGWIELNFPAIEEKSVSIRNIA